MQADRDSPKLRRYTTFEIFTTICRLYLLFLDFHLEWISFVCAEPYHYGVETCEACRLFFSSSVKNNSQYACKFQQECEIDRDDRECSYCRLQKCFRVGMKREGKYFIAFFCVMTNSRGCKYQLYTLFQLTFYCKISNFANKVGYGTSFT